MSIEIYTISGAPRGWRVLLGLAFKHLDYDTQYLQLSKNEHKSDAYLKINPNGTVPSVVTSEITIIDSISALAWLDRRYPDHPIFGANHIESAEIWQATRHSCEFLRDAAMKLLVPILFSDTVSVTPVLCEAAISMQMEIAHIEKLLGKDDFIIGNMPSAADAVAYPEIRLVQRAMETKPELMRGLGFNDDFVNYPNLAKWKSRIERLEGFERTLPVHWS